MTTPYGARLAEAVARTGAPVCVGLDPFPGRVPGWTPDLDPAAAADRVRVFCEGVLDAVAGLVPAVKPQSAFFEALGAPGVAAFHAVCRGARARGLLVVADAKRGDIGSTAEAYARTFLDDDGPCGADAVTVSPWLGPESLAPYLQRPGKGVYVLVRTSNPDAHGWQRDTGAAAAVADWIAARNAHPGPGSVGAVVGATLPRAEVEAWRGRMPNTPFLVPGFGAQGAGVDDVRPHFLPDGSGALVTSSREVLYPKQGVEGADFAVHVRARAESFVASARALLPGGLPAR
jgi:orotidine-5'-phosphate decarboxylase